MASSEPSGPPWGLERRLRTRLLGWVALLWLAGCAVALVALREETGEVLDSALEETAQRLLVLPESALAAGDAEARLAHVGAHDETVVYQVFDGAGRLRLRSHQAPGEALAPAAARGLADRGAWRVSSLARPDGSRTVHVAEARAHRREVLWESSLWLVLPLIAVLPLAGWLLQRELRAGFRTLEPARAALAAHGAGPLRPLPLAGTPAELQPLLRAMNGLMDRLQGLLDAERELAARSAHELRTPLAAARAQAQRLEREVQDGALVGRVQALSRQIDRITALANRLLQRSRIESGVAWRREPVDLALLARLVVDEFADRRHGARLRLEPADDAAEVLGDPDALAIALRNLIDNALKHGGDAAQVRVSVDAGGFAVVDDGPGVATADLARLVQPYERGRSSAEGSGLGLAMVDLIARQSGGRLELRSPLGDGGRGFEASLHLPSAAPPRR